jgi:nucleoside-diphosphate-sugar epimerase
MLSLPDLQHVRLSRADLTRAQQELGYEPTVPLLEWIRRTVASYQAELAHVAPDEVTIVQADA